MIEPHEARRRTHALLQRFGWNATSFQVLEPQFRYWFVGDDAVVAYVQTGRSRVVAGGPICDESRLDEVTKRFIRHSREEGFRVCFFPVEERLLDRIDLFALQIGVQPWWDPSRWSDVLASRRRLREQLRRARAKEVRIELVDPAELARDSPLRVTIDAVIREWSATRAMAPMAFLVDVEPFEYAESRRYFVAHHRGRIVAFAAVVPVYARNGWFLEDLIRSTDAPNGTTESLIDAVMRASASDGSTYVTLGIAPLADARGLLGAIRRATRSLYNFEGVLSFKRKLGPTGEDRVYLAFEQGGSPLRHIVDLLRAFARRSFVSFGIDTLFRAPALVIRVLAMLLLFWTCLLAQPAAAKYFPSEPVRLAWVVFDLSLVPALIALSMRWRRWLSTLLLAVIGADALLSIMQFARFNIRQEWRPWEWLVMTIALLAPLFASGVLIGGLRRHRRG